MRAFLIEGILYNKFIYLSLKVLSKWSTHIYEKYELFCYIEKRAYDSTISYQKLDTFIKIILLHNGSCRNSSGQLYNYKISF